jgi:hypothetical protein
MNANSVLNKIMTLLSLDEEVNMTYAKLKDGTIVESPTFDVGEVLDVVSEDGTKTPAPDGEHELSLKDESGNENLIKVIVKDGKIVERENVELDGDMIPEEEPTTEVEVEVEKEEEMGEAEKVKTEALPGAPDPLTKLQYRIDEMEKVMEEMKQKFDSAYPPEGAEVSSLSPNPSLEMAAEPDEEEEELPKLDGAPVDVNLAAIESNVKNFGQKEKSMQNSVLSKLYR